MGTSLICLAHRFIFLKLLEAIYDQNAPVFLNQIISGQHVHSLSYYQGILKSLVLEGLIYFWLFGVFLIFPKNFQLFITALLFLVVSIEIVIRVSNFYWNSLFPTELVDEKKTLMEYDSTLGWKNTANQEAEFILKRDKIREKVKINSKGLRDGELSYKKTEDSKRVLLLGDSFVVGFEVGQEKVIDKRLEEYLSSYGNFEVINAGTRGYGTDQAYLYLKTEGYKYDPDIIIYVFVSNDPQNNVTIHRPWKKYGKSYFVLDQDNNLVLKGVPVPKTYTPHGSWKMSDEKIEAVFNAYKEAQVKKKEGFQSSLLGRIDRYFLNRLEFYKWGVEKLRGSGKVRLNPYEDGRAPEWIEESWWKITQSLIQGMSESAEKINASFLIYEATSRGFESRWPSRLEEICHELGIGYLNSFNKFQATSKEDKGFSFKYDSHWAEKGHDLAAREIADFLKRKEFINTN